jgi:hypothetical protein
LRVVWGAITGHQPESTTAEVALDMCEDTQEAGSDRTTVAMAITEEAAEL